MAENLINPSHNVHKKYRTMNFVNHYIFTPPYVAPVENTFIGGVAGTINTAALLATKLAIDVSRITAFSIVGSDIKCKITGSYEMPIGCWINNNSITSYVDSNNLVSKLKAQSFRYANSIKKIEFGGCLEIESYVCENNATEFVFKECLIIGEGAFRGWSYAQTIKRYFVPKATNLGDTVGNNGVFDVNFGDIKVYTNPILATINSGGVEGDLLNDAQKNMTVRYVTSFTVPSLITNLSIGTVYATAMQLNFTAPTGSTNAIDFYECYVNGIYKNTITASGTYITGLSPNTSYTIEVKPVDVFYNKSNSNVVVQSTIATYYTDSDANAYISAASLSSSEQESAYKLIVDLKTNSLWTKIQAIYPFKGTTAAQHKWNAKSPVDTDLAFRLTFNGVGTFTNNGFLTNGTGNYANTHLIPSDVQLANSNGMTIVVGEIDSTSSGNDFIMGAYQNATTMSLIANRNNNSNYAKKIRLNGSEVSVSNGNTPRGIFTGVKQSATVTKLFQNSILQVSGNSGGNLPSIKIWIGDNDSNGSSYSNIKARIQTAIIHEGLSDAEVATLHSIIDLSESIAGRKTW